MVCFEFWYHKNIHMENKHMICTIGTTITNTIFDWCISYGCCLTSSTRKLFTKIKDSCYFLQ